MNLICGDALGITCGTWIQLWSGTIGAFFAAIIGGLVALMVVRLTSGQNARQAEQTLQIAAIADLVAAAEAALHARPMNKDEIFSSDIFLSMRAALIRLRMAGGDGFPLALALEGWPYRIESLRTNLGAARVVGDENAAAIYERLNTVVSCLAVVLPRWTHGSKLERKGCLITIGMVDEQLTEYFESKAESSEDK